MATLLKTLHLLQFVAFTTHPPTPPASTYFETLSTTNPPTEPASAHFRTVSNTFTYFETVSTTHPPHPPPLTSKQLQPPTHFWPWSRSTVTGRRSLDTNGATSLPGGHAPPSQQKKSAEQSALAIVLDFPAFLPLYAMPSRFRTGVR